MRKSSCHLNQVSAALKGSSTLRFGKSILPGSLVTTRASPTSSVTTDGLTVRASILVTFVQSRPSMVRRKFDGNHGFCFLGVIVDAPETVPNRVTSGENLIVILHASLDAASRAGMP